ncbi:MAG TPA: hypothetical protein VG870_00540 [Chitinophagaceae bacterium]|nr:hypothetical protein [Chitinophagaceae bacterium]
MKRTLLAVLIGSSLTGASQTIHTSIVDDPVVMRHTINAFLREKTEYLDGENTIQIENTGNNMLQLGYTAKLSTEKHGLILHRISPDGKDLETNKLEDGKRAFGPLSTLSLEFSHRILLVYFKYEDKDSMKLFISEIDRKNLSLIHTQQIYSYQQDNVGIFKMARALKHTTMYQVSPDSSKLLVCLQDTKGSFFSIVLDDQLNTLRKGVSRNPVFADNEVTACLLENSGHAAFVVSRPVQGFSTQPLQGILIQRLDGREKYQDLAGTGTDGALLNCHLQASRDNARIFAFGDYSGEVGSAGTWLAEINPTDLRISRASIFPYPSDYTEQLYKIGFGVRHRGTYGVLDVDYDLAELDDGSLALGGTPVSRHDNRNWDPGTNSHSGYVMYYAGPVMTAFFDKNRKGKSYGLIPRNENLSQGSALILLPYQDRLIVFFNDYEKNFTEPLMENDVHKSGGAVIHELSLGYGVFSEKGAVLDRKMISQGVSRMECFNTALGRLLANNKLAIPSSTIDKNSKTYKVALITVE